MYFNRSRKQAAAGVYFSDYQLMFVSLLGEVYDDTYVPSSNRFLRNISLVVDIEVCI